MAIKRADYLRHHTLIASTETECSPYVCTKFGCQFPHCSLDFRKFSSEAQADKYEKKLADKGLTIKSENFGE